MSDQARIAEILRCAGILLPNNYTRSWDYNRALNELAAQIDAVVHPRIDTVEQLDALPFLTIVREVYGPSPSGCDYGAVWERRTSGWQCIAGSVMPPRDEHAPRLGCRVLYTPEPGALRDQETTHA